MKRSGLTHLSDLFLAMYVLFDDYDCMEMAALVSNAAIEGFEKGMHQGFNIGAKRGAK